MRNHRVSLAFAKLPDATLDQFAHAVLAGMTGNPAFPTPPVPLTELAALQSSFHEAIVAAADGGRQATAAKNAARQALVLALRSEAAYVQTVASQNLPLLLSSGFDAVNTNSAPAPLAKPSILRIDNDASTTLTVRLERVPNARAYEGRLSIPAGTWQPAGMFTQARRVTVTNLTPGTMYTFQFRAIGGSAGYSDWSDPVSHMAM